MAVQSLSPASEPTRLVILNLLRGIRQPLIPCFSGLISISAAVLETRGLRFHEIHTDAQKMVAAAVAAYELAGLQSAVLPTDLCVEAEALGAEVDFRRDTADEPMWPLVTQPLFATPADVHLERRTGSASVLHGDVLARGRLPLIQEALRQLKERVGQEIVIGAWIPGPFTLALQVVEQSALFIGVKRDPHAVARALDELTEILVPIAEAYRRAGADFITVHEMGGSPGVLGPQLFGALVLPRLRRLVAALPAPRVLSVCGRTNAAVELLAQVGADALSVDQLNDLAHTRRVLGSEAILLGNLDPVRELGQGDAHTIRAAVERAFNAGADAIWPGCDLYLRTPLENLRAWVEATRRLRRK